MQDTPAVMEGAAASPFRDFSRLFVAIDHAIETLASDANEEDALRDSFRAAADGFGAKKCLLLLVQQAEPLRLRNVQAKGLTPDQVRACEEGQSVPKVSSSLIREVAASGQSRARNDPRLFTASDETASSAEGGYSAICAPVLDPFQGTVLAVLYFQHTDLPQAYGESDLVFLSAYAKALGRAFGAFLRERKRRQAREQSGDAHEASDIIGDSPQTHQLRELLIERYIQAANVPNPYPILVYGAPGTGKELIAKFLHDYSDRRRQPYVIANCAELKAETAGARLFGSKRGAYTSSIADEKGYFRAAHKGVLFLDEIGQLELSVQAMLLRALENRTITPLGETQQVPVDVLVVLATNRNLEEAVREKQFLPDLYDRFRIHRIELLPLQARPLDIPVLVEYFRQVSEKRYRKRLLGFTADGMRSLIGYAWPGNVREVERTVDLLVLAARAGARLDRAFISATCPHLFEPTSRVEHQHPIGLPDDIKLDEALDLFKRDILVSRLEQHKWNIGAARTSLGLSASSMLRYMKDLRIRKPEPSGEQLGLL